MVYMSKNAFGQDDENSYITGSPNQSPSSSGGIIGSGGSSGNGYGASTQSNSLQQSDNQGRVPEGFVNMQRYVGQNQDDLINNINSQGKHVQDTLNFYRDQPWYKEPDLSSDQPDSYDPATLEKMAKMIWQKDPNSQQAVDFFTKASEPNFKIMNTHHVSTELPGDTEGTTQSIWSPEAAKTGSEGSYYYGKHMPVTPAYSQGNQNLDDAIFGASGGRQAAKSNYDQASGAMNNFVDTSNTINRNIDLAQSREDARAKGVRDWGANYVTGLAGRSQESSDPDGLLKKLAGLVDYTGPINYAAPKPEKNDVDETGSGDHTNVHVQRQWERHSRGPGSNDYGAGGVITDEDGNIISYN